MTTLYAAALKLVGLSQREAAAFHGVRIDTVKSWAAGRNGVPDGAWTELRGLYRKQRRSAQEALNLILGKQPDELALNMAGPRMADWPAPGAYHAVNAMVALETDIKIVPLE